MMPALGGKRESTGFFNTARPYGEREKSKSRKVEKSLPRCVVCAVLRAGAVCAVWAVPAGLCCAVLCCAVLCAVCCVL